MLKSSLDLLILSNMRNKRMNPKLHKLLLELDNRDWTSDDYFNWSEAQKQNLTEDILRMFYPLIRTGSIQSDYLKFGLYSSIRDAEDIEDYEQAEILNRCLQAVEKITFNSIY